MDKGRELRSPSKAFPHEEGKVHRGKVDCGRESLLTKTLKNLGADTDLLQIEGSMARGPRGANYTDLDISGTPPPGLSRKELDALEETIRRETNIDFYFRDE